MRCVARRCRRRARGPRARTRRRCPRLPRAAGRRRTSASNQVATAIAPVAADTSNQVTESFGLSSESSEDQLREGDREQQGAGDAVDGLPWAATPIRPSAVDGPVTSRSTAGAPAGTEGWGQRLARGLPFAVRIEISTKPIATRIAPTAGSRPSRRPASAAEPASPLRASLDAGQAENQPGGGKLCLKVNASGPGPRSRSNSSRSSKLASPGEPGRWNGSRCRAGRGESRSGDIPPGTGCSRAPPPAW